MRAERIHPVSMRPVSYEDYLDCKIFEEAVGFPETSSAYWEKLWANPGRGLEQPLGWVLEAEGRIVGYFGNIPMLFAFGREMIRGAAAKGVAVIPELRGTVWPRRLAEAFLSQGETDLLVSTTTNTVAGRFFQKIGFQPVPQPEYDIALLWVLDRLACARAAVQRWIRRRRGKGRAVRGRSTCRGREGGRAGEVMGTLAPGMRVLTVEDIDTRFDALWEAKRRESQRLLAWRSSEFLRWHFRGVREAVVVACESGGSLEGYAILVPRERLEIGLRRLWVADCLVRDDSEVVIRRLLQAALVLARSLKYHVLEIQGFPAPVRQSARAMGAKPRRLPASPYYYRAGTPELSAVLVSAERWYACPYDGDATLRC